jgi:hypothetical protein
MSYLLAIGIIFASIGSIANSISIHKLHDEVKKNRVLIEKICTDWPDSREIQETCDWYASER